MNAYQKRRKRELVGKDPTVSYQSGDLKGRRGERESERERERLIIITFNTANKTEENKTVKNCQAASSAFLLSPFSDF